MIKRITIHIDVDENSDPIDYMKGPLYKLKLDSLYDEVLRQPRKYGELQNYGELSSEQQEAIEVLITNIIDYLNEE
jgi:hypothetical protein